MKKFANQYDIVFPIGQIVYLKTDIDQAPRVVIAQTLRACGSVVYTLGCGVEETGHYEVEISTERNITIDSDEEK